MKKLFISLFITAIAVTSVSSVSAHFVDGKFDHHAHVSEGNPFKSKEVEGFTTYPEKYHYTTAELQNRDGDVMATSQRIWGQEKTSAYTSYYGLTQTFARTYYGS